MRYELMAINILFAMISALLVLFYLKNNRIEYCKKYSIIYAISFGIMNGVLSTKAASLGNAVNTVKPILIIVSSILIIKFFLGLSFRKSATVFLLLAVGMGIGNSIGFLVLMPFLKGYPVEEITSNIFLYSASNLIVTVCTLLFIYVLKPVNHIIRQILGNRELTFALIFTLVIICANTGLHFYINVFDFTAFLVITIMSALYCGYLIFNSTVIYKRQIEKADKEQQHFYNQSLEDTLFHLRRFKHDWDNNLMTINTMLIMNKYEEAKSYLQEIVDYNNTQNNTLLYNIKNAGLFGIISSKQSLAINRGIRVEVSGTGEIKDIPEIKISELCEIVGIFLDNAIEESVKLNLNVEFQYISTPNILEIRIRNKCRDHIDLNTLGAISAKGTDHGNGLKIVDQITSKYKGIRNLRSYEMENRVFEQLIIIENRL